MSLGLGCLAAAARRLLDQQSGELPLCESQQERSRQPQQQCWVSGGVASGVSTPNRQSRQMGICREYFWESRPSPVRGATLSKNKPEPDGLVGSPKTHPVRL